VRRKLTARDHQTHSRARGGAIFSKRSRRERRPESKPSSQTATMIVLMIVLAALIVLVSVDAGETGS
jgi:hypothetical protein